MLELYRHYKNHYLYTIDKIADKFENTVKPKLFCNLDFYGLYAS